MCKGVKSHKVDKHYELYYSCNAVNSKDMSPINNIDYNNEDF